jgi:hypothetical protein
MFPGRLPETQVTPTYFVILARQCMATEYGVHPGEVPCRPRQSLACALIDQASSQPYFNALKAAQTQLCNSTYHRTHLLESCPAPRCDLSRVAHVAYEVGNLRASPWSTDSHVLLALRGCFSILGGFWLTNVAKSLDTTYYLIISSLLPSSSFASATQ